MSQSKSNLIISLKNKVTDTELRKKIREVFSVGKTRANEIFHQLFDLNQQNNEEIPNKKSATFKVSKDNGVAEVVDEDVKTLEELLEVCKVNLEEWRVEKYIVNKWATARKDRKVDLSYNAGAANGTVNDKGGMIVQPLYQVKAWLVRKRAAKDFKLILYRFIENAKNYAPAKFEYEEPLESGKLLEISIPDLHLSKLCWSKETSYEDYDIKIAPELYKNAVYDFLGKIQHLNVKKILLPIGNDFFNSNNAEGTTAKGTPQAAHEDSRWPKTFNVGCELLSFVIELLANKYEVEVKVIPGNHDYERAYYLGEYLRAWFRNHPKVVIDNAPTQRKYYRFGKNLIGFTHGSEEKHEKLPLIMANDRKEDWAITNFREWHTGHLHHEAVKEFNGVKVRILPSLMPPDYWHSSKGYVGTIRGAEAFLYDEENGLIAIYYHNIA